MGREERNTSSVSEDGNRRERSFQALGTEKQAGAPTCDENLLGGAPVADLVPLPRLTFLAVFRVISDGVSRWMPLMVAKMMGAPGTWREGREGVQSQAQS